MTAQLFVTHLGWVLLHFVWQGALIGCATAVALLVLRNARPEARYAVACSGLLLCLVWPAAGLVLRLAGDSEPVPLGVPLGALTTVGVAQMADGWIDLLQGQLHLVVGVWACCAAALGLRMALGLVWVGRAARATTTDPQWQARLSALAARCGLQRAVRLRIVDGLASPVTAGWLKPLVLVPAALLTNMPPHLLEALLAHELGHVRRSDYLVNLVQSVIETMLFYHPAVWWISARIRSEREQIADDFAARQLGEPRRLALALSELERLQFSTHHLAQAANGGDLMSRIKRLVRPDTQVLNWKAAVPALGLALACLAGTQAAIAAQSKPDPAAGKGDSHAIADFQSCAKPEYPAEALALKATGTVTLGYLIGAEGKVLASRVEKSSGNRQLDGAARDAIGKCSFTPAIVRGKPVKKWESVQYVWSLD